MEAIRTISVGDTVRITNTSKYYKDESTSLSDRIGQVSTVLEICGNADQVCAVKLKFNSECNWYHDTSIEIVGDVIIKHLEMVDIHPNKCVYIGRSLQYLLLNTINRRINIMLGNNYNNIEDELYYIYGKKAKVINTDFIMYYKSRAYIGVEIDNKVYYIPPIVLYAINPKYKPRKIFKNI